MMISERREGGLGLDEIKQKDMRRLAAHQLWLREHPQLTFLFFELTDRCNLRCRHCGSSCTGANRNLLPFDAVERVLRRVAGRYDPKKILVCLTGGEPLLYPELTRVIAAARGLGFPVGMTTNGTLIGEHEANALAAAGLDTVAVSADGLGAVHDAFRRQEGSFDAAISGARALQAAGLSPQIISVIHPGNIRQLDEMCRYFQSEGFYSWRVVNVDPIGRARGNAACLLDAQQLRTLYDFIRAKRMDPACRMEVTYGCSHFVTFAYERMLRDFYFQCGAGTKVASVAANGDILACLDIERRPELVQGSIREDDFIDVWENRFRPFRTDRTARSAVCRACEHREICMGDSAHTWNYDRDEPNYCVVKLWEGES